MFSRIVIFRAFKFLISCGCENWKKPLLSLFRFESTGQSILISFIFHLTWIFSRRNYTILRWDGFGVNSSEGASKFQGWLLWAHRVGKTLRVLDADGSISNERRREEGSALMADFTTHEIIWRTSHYFYRLFKFGTRKLIEDYDVSRFVDLAAKILKKIQADKIRAEIEKKLIPIPAVKIHIDFIYFATLLIKRVAHIVRFYALLFE